VQTRAAQRRIARWVQKTPLTLVHNGLYVKREDLQKSVSFKVRGVANVLASAAARGRLPKELAVVSSGNTALAACHLAAKFNVGVTAYVPRFVSTAKCEALSQAGARIKLVKGGSVARRGRPLLCRGLW
jgi:threonine dehydratase